jgi:hypothetical protein
MTRPRTLLLAATLLSLAACNDAAPATADAGSLAATPTDAAAATDVAIAADASLAPEDVPAPERFSYVPMGCTHRVRAPLGSTNNSRDDRTTFGAAPDPRDVHVNWPADPSSTIAFLWQTDPGTRATVVQYGTEPHGPRPDRGRQREHRRASLAEVTIHEVHVCGLRPDTTYHYRVGGEGHWSAVQRFKTAPAPGRTDYDVQLRRGRRLARQLQPPGARCRSACDGRMNPPDFQIFTGDAVLRRVPPGRSGSSWFEGARSAWRRCPS